MKPRAVRLALLAAVLLLAPLPALGHVFRPAYLELRQVSDDTYDVTWKVPARSEGVPVAIHLRLPEDCAYLSGPREVFSNGAYITRSQVRRLGGLAGRSVTVEGLVAGELEVLARVERLDGSTQVARLLPASPGFVVEAATGLSDTAWTYLRLGVHHILSGADHLLFVLALLLIVRGVRRVIATITAFTVAHSITLAAATLGVVHVPQAPVEATIALSIVFVAVEIVHGLQGRPGLTARRPWIVASTFGLLHGFGFAGALSEVGLPQHAIPMALLFFNLGVEVGQLLFVGGVAAAALLRRRARIVWPPWAAYLPPYAIGALAMFWVTERVVAFWG